MFSGEFFDATEEGRSLRNLLLDFYRGDLLDKVALKGLEHVISVTADPLVPGRIHFRVFLVRLMKAAGRVPRVELEEMGPRFVWRIGRTRLADADVWKTATKVSRTLKVYHD
jgi:ribosome production factor 2